MKLFFENYVDDVDDDVLVTDSNKEEFIDWLSEHKTAYADLLRFFKKDEDTVYDISAYKLDDWLGYHETLSNDWIRYIS